jgi:hypothetical protein
MLPEEARVDALGPSRDDFGVTLTGSALRVLDRAVWSTLARAHEVRAEQLTAGHRERRRAGRSHPVEDFLFTYYSLRPAQLRRWHPGLGVGLADAPELLRRRWYAEVEPGSAGLDVSAYLADRGELVRFVASLLSATAERPAQLGCFGLHEWAMVYRLGPDEVRHESWPLRLGPEGTDAVVDGHQFRCSHYDAFRFFTPDAISRNAVQPTRGRQVELEQPGCLHASMDLYTAGSGDSVRVSSQGQVVRVTSVERGRQHEPCRHLFRPGRAAGVRSERTAAVSGPIGSSSPAVRPST